MLNNKKINIALSIIIAIGLWLYVVGKINPEVHKTYSDIPINITNQNMLNERGYAILSTSDTTMSITLSGSRNDISNVDPKNIVARIDASNLKKGENEVEVKVSSPGYTKVSDKSISKVTVMVDKLVSKEKTVKVVYDGSYDKSEEPTTVSQELEEITISGAQQLVNKVSYVKATVLTSEVGESRKDVNATLMAVDENDKEVANISMPQTSMSVDAYIAKVKAVGLTVPIIDNSNGDVEKKVDAPTKVVIKGAKASIDGINSITAQPVDISGVTADTTFPVEIALPEGVELANTSANLNVKVITEIQKTKSFNFTNKDVEITGLEEGFDGEVTTGAIKITVTGTKEMLDQIKASDIHLSVDLAGLAEGIHRVELKVSCSATNSGVNSEPDSVEVTIKKKN